MKNVLGFIGYTVENEILQKLIVVEEDSVKSLLTTEIDEDAGPSDSFLDMGIEAFSKDTGIKIGDISKWLWLDELTSSDTKMYLFGVNVSGKENEFVPSDKSCKYLDIEDALKTKDVFVYAAFFKLFMQVYKKTL